jgi:CheY-like chemotaxis protein
MSTILVVDDEADTRYVVRQILEMDGHNVLEAHDGGACLEKMRESKPDLVLLDIMMPGLSGWEVLGEVKGNSELKSVPVTMFTVKPLTPAIIKRKDVDGLVNYIVKPFSNDGLLESVNHTLKSLQLARNAKNKIGSVDGEKAEEYGEVSRLVILHNNFLSLLGGIVKQRKEDGSMDDIQSFEDVIRSESKLIDSYVKRKEELESVI